MGVAGPMARKTRDLAALLAVQSGYDPRVPLSIRQDPAAFLAPLERDVKGLRIAWLGDLGGHLPTEDGVLSVCREALKAFEGLGAIVDDVALGFDPESIWQAWIKLRAFQAGGNLAALYDDPAKRPLLKPEAQFEVEQGRNLSAYDVTRA